MKKLALLMFVILAMPLAELAQVFIRARKKVPTKAIVPRVRSGPSWVAMVGAAVGGC